MATSQGSMSDAPIVSGPLAFANTPPLPASQVTTQNPTSIWATEEGRVRSKRAIWDENRSPYAATDKVLFLPSESLLLRSEPNKTQTTKIGLNVFIKQEYYAFVTTMNQNQQDAVIFLKHKQQNEGAWLPKFNEELHGEDGQNHSSFHTPSGRVLMSYDAGSVNAMDSLKQIQYQLAAAVCPFSVLPSEVKESIYRFAVTRFFRVEVDGTAITTAPWAKAGGNNPSLLLNLQHTCRYLHQDVSSFIYKHNEFYFGGPETLDWFLKKLQCNPGPLCLERPSLHFGTVLLEIRREGAFRPDGHPRQDCRMGPVLHLGFGDDWAAHTKYFVKPSAPYRPSRGCAISATAKSETWATAITTLLQEHTVGKLVLIGDENWKTGLKGYSPIIDAITAFKGQNRVTRVYQAGQWPADKQKTMQRLLEIEEGAVAASQSTTLNRPRRRQAKRNRAVEEDEGVMAETNGRKRRKATEKASSRKA